MPEKTRYKIHVDLELTWKDIPSDLIHRKCLEKLASIGLKSVKNATVHKVIPKKDLYADGRDLL